jgi:hypothetical protein
MMIDWAMIEFIDLEPQLLVLTSKNSTNTYRAKYFDNGVLMIAW